jgi:tetratricopeptide (TPR) repeat protein
MRRRYCTAALTVTLLMLAVRGLADESAWRDIEGRIQYAYYTEDARGLVALEEAVAPAESHDALRDYYGALLAWREALLVGQGVPLGGGRSAAQLLDRCAQRIEQALSTKGDFAEGLTLRAACLLSREYGSAHGSLTTHRAHKDLERAAQLAPGNPRVLLVDAVGDYELAGGGGGNKERALGKLRQASAAFEAERRDAERVPGWGAADSYYYLARDLLDHGDGVGARDALERALVIAPGYNRARALLSKLTAG